jgi:hypothetical protein
MIPDTGTPDDFFAVLRAACQAGSGPEDVEIVDYH